MMTLRERLARFLCEEHAFRTRMGPFWNDLSSTQKDLWREVEFTDRKGDEGWWTLDQLKAGARLALTSEPYVAMVHGDNVANKAPFRVNPTTREVHNGAEYTWLGAREAALEVMGQDALERFEAAVA